MSGKFLVRSSLIGQNEERAKGHKDQENRAVGSGRAFRREIHSQESLLVGYCSIIIAVLTCSNKLDSSWSQPTANNVTMDGEYFGIRPSLPSEVHVFHAEIVHPSHLSILIPMLGLVGCPL
jgi:hypothetical protein